MAEELIPVNIVIGDRTYRIKTLASDEEAIRRTVKTVNDKIVDFKTQFGGKDMQDYIAMVLVWYATEQTAGGTADIQNEDVQTRLISIEKLLDNQLSGS